MIDIKKAKEVFKEYVQNYDAENYKVKLKIAHTYRVAEVAKEIAIRLKLTKEQIELAELIGLLHDIGRFEQIKRYNTFNDSISINHAELGSQILFKQGMIRKFIKEETYDTIIKKAIENHNKWKIEEGMEAEELLQSKIIRDADKTDILYIYTGDYFEYVFRDKDKAKEFISQKVMEAFERKETVDKKECKTTLDNCIVGVAFIFDYNFKESLDIIKEKDYMNILLEHLYGFSKETQKQMEKIKEIVKEYLK